MQDKHVYYHKIFVSGVVVVTSLVEITVFTLVHDGNKERFDEDNSKSRGEDLKVEKTTESSNRDSNLVAKSDRQKQYYHPYVQQQRSPRDEIRRIRRSSEAEMSNDHDEAPEYTK